jgi:hypothetical protein
VSPVPPATFVPGAALALSRDNNTLYYGGNCIAAVHAESMTSGQLVALSNDLVTSLALSGDQQSLYASCLYTNQVWVYQANNLAAPPTSIFTAGVLVMSPDGATLYIVSLNGTIGVIDTATNTCKHQENVLSPAVFPWVATISRDGSTLFAACVMASNLSMFAIDTTSFAVTTVTSGVGGAIVAAPSGHIIYAAPMAGQALTVDAFSIPDYTLVGQSSVLPAPPNSDLFLQSLVTDPSGGLYAVVQVMVNSDNAPYTTYSNVLTVSDPTRGTAATLGTFPSQQYWSGAALVDSVGARLYYADVTGVTAFSSGAVGVGAGSFELSRRPAKSVSQE